MNASTDTLDHMLITLRRSWTGRYSLLMLATAPLHLLITWTISGAPQWPGLLFTASLGALAVCRTRDQIYSALVGQGLACLVVIAYASIGLTLGRYLFAGAFTATYLITALCYGVLARIYTRRYRPPTCAWVNLPSGVQLPLDVVATPCGTDDCLRCESPHWTLYARHRPIEFTDVAGFHVDGRELRRRDVGPAEIVDGDGRRWLPALSEAEQV